MQAQLRAAGLGRREKRRTVLLPMLGQPEGTRQSTLGGERLLLQTSSRASGGANVGRSLQRPSFVKSAEYKKACALMVCAHVGGVYVCVCVVPPNWSVDICILSPYMHE